MRSKIEKQIRAVINTNISKEEVEEKFPALSPTQVDTIQKILCDMKWLLDKELTHVWEDEGADTICSWRILKLKKRGKGHIAVVAYWMEGENEGAAEDYQVSLPQLVTDVICGELAFF